MAAANGLISPSFAGGFRRKVLTWPRGISRKFFEPAIHVAVVADPRTCEKAPAVGLGRAVGAFSAEARILGRTTVWGAFDT